MKGRIFHVKKTTIITLSFVISLCAIIGLGLFSGIKLKHFNAWFFIFCLFVGLHFLLRANLIRVDSNCYLGWTMFLVGAMYFYSKHFEVFELYPAFIVMSFAFGSLFTYFQYKQPFQLTLFFSLIFVTFALTFYILNLISSYFFLAILVLSVLLLVCRYFML